MQLSDHNNLFQLHDYMTDEEIFQVFNSHRHAVPEYELGSIDHEQHKNGLRIKRSVDNQTVFFKAFGKNIELFLEPNDHVLYGSATPLYIASYSGGKIRYKNRLYVSLSSILKKKKKLLCQIGFYLYQTALTKKYEKLRR